LAVASAAVACSQAIWCYFTIISHTPDPSSVAGDVLELVAVPFALAGLVTFVRSPSHGLTNLRNLLDSTLIGSSCLFIAWTTVLSTIYSHAGGGIVTHAVDLAFPVGDLVIASLVLIVATRAGPRRRTSFHLVAAGLIAFAIADTAFAYLHTLHRYGTGNVTDTAWVLGFCLVSLGAYWNYLHPEVTGERLARSTTWTVVGPYLPLAGAIAAAVWQAVAHRSLDRFSQATFIVVIMVVAVRQVVVLLDNMSLSRRLETRVEQRTAQLRHREFHDGLTGLANRALFAEYLDTAVARQRRSGASLVIVLINLFDFTRFNDLHGSLIGDDIIRSVAARLRSTVRDADSIARIGGDEYGLLLEGPATDLSAEAAATKLLATLAAPYGIAGQSFSVHASLGVASCSPGESTGDSLIREASLALHAAKTRGGHCFEVYSESVHSFILERMRTEAELGGALESEELRVYYQPVLDASTCTVVGVEALVRWEHPQRGLLTPDQFVPQAERNGMIIEVGTWVLRQACCDIQALSSPGLPLTLGVNLSARQLDDDTVVSTVARVLSESGLAPERLTLEVTESAIMDDVDRAAETLRRLRDIGVEIAIDDFGTGYSTLGTLRQLPVDTLKVDRSFVMDVAVDQAAADLTRRTLQLAADFELKTVAEGVEDAEQLHLLVELGCQCVQGYLFSRPVPLDQLGPLLATGFFSRFGRPKVQSSVCQTPLEGTRQVARSRAF
jgi:diguanylate cyclase (GGDEF)-like protein